MRLSTDGERGARDEARALATLRAALDAGAGVLDTARAYGLDDADAGHNERLVARAVLESGRDPRGVRIVTKCGMRRPIGPGGAAGWAPDGRAASIAGDVRASREALGALPVDLVLLHARDPRTPLATSVRALARAADGVARGIGLANVSMTELEAARKVAPIAAVEVALGAFDDAAARGGLLRYCAAHGVEVLAHAPLGGPSRAPRLARDRALAPLARDLGVTPAELVLAYLLYLAPDLALVALPGARRPETAASAIGAARIALDGAALARLDDRFPGLAAARRPPPRAPADATREVVLFVGVPGAGKSRAAAAYEARGYTRWSRDALGGTLARLAKLAGERLAAGDERLVLDNTYLRRAERGDAIAVAHRHGARVRCVFFDTAVADAQINVVLRMLDRHGELLGPDALARAAKTDANMIAPGPHFRAARDLEPPSLDEGFSAIDVVPFRRDPPSPYGDGPSAVVALDAIARVDDSGAFAIDGAAIARVRDAPGPWLLLAWRPDAAASWRAGARAVAAELASVCERTVDLGLCDHAAGPPVCWCRPPLPGLWLSFARRHHLAPARSALFSASPAHASLARNLGIPVAT